MGNSPNVAEIAALAQAFHQFAQGALTLPDHNKINERLLQRFCGQKGRMPPTPDNRRTTQFAHGL
jgi:hypothetical protein